MRQAKPSGFNWKLYGGILAVGLIAYFTIGSSPAPPATQAATKKKPAATPGVTQLQPIDFNATPTMFKPVMFDIQDKFTPLVYRMQPVGSPDIIRPNELTIPGNFTGAETNWAFTGVVDVDGKRSALVENGTSGQSEYLHPGEKWKTSSVKDITENVLILRDVSGAQKNIRMQADVQAAIAKQQADLAELKVNASASKTVTAPNAPLDPGLVGAIGTDTTVQADGSSGQSYQQAAGGRGRGGGGRGGGGGGGGGRGGRGGGRGGAGNGGGG